MTDVDGRALTDFWFNATSLPLGHAHPAVVAAIQAQAPLGHRLFRADEHEIALGRAAARRAFPAPSASASPTRAARR